MEESATTITTYSEGPTPELWESYRPTIRRLYIEEDKTLPQVMEIMERDFRFKGSAKMYKRRLTLWKMDAKNLTRKAVKQIARKKVERDAMGKQSTFSIKGRDIDIETVQRYLKKHDFSSLESFDKVASPIVHETNIICLTPARSPTLSNLHMSKAEGQDDNHQHHEVTSLQCCQYSSVESQIPQCDGLPLRRIFDPRLVLNMSPEARSRRLLSISPVPHPIALPVALLLPEQMLSTLSILFQGSFEAGTWETGTNGYLYSKKASSLRDTTERSGHCNTVIMLLGEKKYVQARQLLSEMCARIELHVKSESPDLVENLLRTVRQLQTEKLHAIASILLRHGFHLATQFLGNQHPVALMCGMLLELEELTRELSIRLMLCQLSHLEKELGLRHLKTIRTLHNLIRTVETNEAVERSQIALAAYEQMCPDQDWGWFTCMDMLGEALFCNRQYPDARRVGCAFLDAADQALSPGAAHYHKARAFSLLSDVALAAEDNLVEAERHSRHSVEEAAAAWEPRFPDTINYMVRHAELLRRLNRFEEAFEVETRVQYLLGPPEIVELIS